MQSEGKQEVTVSEPLGFVFNIIYSKNVLSIMVNWASLISGTYLCCSHYSPKRIMLFWGTFVSIEPRGQLQQGSSCLLYPTFLSFVGSLDQFPLSSVPFAHYVTFSTSTSTSTWTCTSTHSSSAQKLLKPCSGA